MKVVLKIFKYILCLLVIAVLATGVWNIVALQDFYSSANKEFLMPGIEDKNFDEQGIDYDETTGLFFYTGYMHDNSANPIYLVDSNTGETIKTVRLLNSDGSDFCSHAGGIAVTDQFVYIAGSSDCCLYVFDKTEIMQAENEEKIYCISTFQTAINDEDGVKVSFVTKTENMIYVGEFHHPFLPQYKLRDNHKLSTINGNNSAILIGFSIDSEASLGLSAQPVVAYSLPDKVQGVCFSKGKIILSESFGLLPSVISYNESIENGTFTIMNTTVPLYSLKETSKVIAPPMNEEIDEFNGKLYIASELYNFVFKGFGQLWGGQYCWSIAE